MQINVVSHNRVSQYMQCLRVRVAFFSIYSLMKVTTVGPYFTDLSAWSESSFASLTTEKMVGPNGLYLVS